MKRFISVLLSVFLTLTFFFPIASCTQKSEDESGKTQAFVGYLALNTYEVTLREGESFSLRVKKFNGSGEEQTVGNVDYVSESPKIADVDDKGNIKATQAGQTYVNVKADGMETACFVTVQSADTENGVVIRFSFEQLFVNVPSQAYAVVVKDGMQIGEAINVTWSSENEDILSVSETGLLMPKQPADSVILKAECTYEGKTYKIEKQVRISDPCYYTFTKPTVKLADLKTLSGKDNKAYTSVENALCRVNVFTNEIKELTKDEFSVSVNNEEVVGVEISADGIITMKAKTVGATMLTARVKETGETIGALIEVATPISSVEDMDVLALACHNNSALLAKSYLLVNDIDFNGDVMLPVAPFNDGNVTSRSIGIQWKYRLRKTSDGYAWVSRSDFGKSGTGLTDNEYYTLAAAGGLNPSNGYKFTGTFDGNGYSIKNAQIFYGTVVQLDSEKYYSGYSGLFGYFNGTMKNISFENITMQDPAKVTIEDSAYGLDRVLTDGSSIQDGALVKTSAGGYIGRTASIIARGEGCVLQNVYCEVTANLNNDRAKFGALVSWASDNALIENCVVYLNDPNTNGKARALCGAGVANPGEVRNNVAVGVTYMTESIANEMQGEKGNWFISDLDWRRLFSAAIGVNATNVRSFADTLTTFDARVWDLSAFAKDKTGRPMLIKGCSATYSYFVQDKPNDLDYDNTEGGADKAWGNLG